VQQSFQVRPDSSFWQHTASAAAKTSEYEVSSVSTLREEPEKPAENAPAEETVTVPDFRLIGEAFKTYLIVEIDNELYFIDKHAAHERMNYEAFRASATVEVQMLLSPTAVNLSKDELNAITENIDLLAKCGFEVEEFGDSAVLVRAVPSLVGDDSVTDLILEIAQKLLEHKTDIEPDKIDWIYHSASCRGAVKGGDTTSPEEQELFVRKLLSMPDIRFCPHGRPVFIKISRYDIEKQFGRV
jgi:DNA mismatch repair protein MutL